LTGWSLVSLYVHLLVNHEDVEHYDCGEHRQLRENPLHKCNGYPDGLRLISPPLSSALCIPSDATVKKNKQ